MGKLARVLGPVAVAAWLMACSSSSDDTLAEPDASGADCLPGQRRIADGCVACEYGSYSSGLNAETCADFTRCEPGAYVLSPGSNVTDRKCAPCPDGTYSSVANQAACTKIGACPAGTIQTASATPTSAPVCEPCPAGTFCAGDTAPKVACAPGTWDEDANSGTACVPWATCEAGQFVSAPGSTTENRSCAACVDGYSTTENAATCAPWTVCAANEYASVLPSAITDRTCAPVFSQITTSLDAESTKRSGETFGYRFDYVCASSSGTCEGAEIVDLLPPEVTFVSTTPSTPTGDVSSVTVTPNYAGSGRTRVRFGLANLAAGAMGSVHIDVRFPNGSTPNGTAATNVGEVTNLGVDPGTLSSAPLLVTAVAEAQITLEQALVSTPANLDRPAAYRLRVNVGSDSGSLRLEALGPVTLTLPPGAVFNGATPAAGCQPGCVGTTPATVTWASPCSMPLAPGNACDVIVNVTFPSSTFPSGTNVTSSFTTNGAPLGLAARALGPAQTTHPVTTFVPSPGASFVKDLVGNVPAVHQAFSYELTIGSSGNVPLDNLVVIDTVPVAMGVTRVTTGRYSGLADFAAGEGVRVSYEKNTAPGIFTLWGSSPNTTTNTTLTAPPPGLGAGEYITRIRRELGQASPGMTAVVRPSISGAIINPDNEGWPVAAGKTVSACATLSAVFTAGPTNVNRTDCEQFAIAAAP